jgi:hypothetical protein
LSIVDLSLKGLKAEKQLKELANREQVKWNKKP